MLNTNTHLEHNRLKMHETELAQIRGLALCGRAAKKKNIWTQISKVLPPEDLKNRGDGIIPEVFKYSSGGVACVAL